MSMVSDMEVFMDVTDVVLTQVLKRLGRKYLRRAFNITPQERTRKRKKVKMSLLGTVFQDIIKELDRQRKKWGEQNHSPEWWLAILGEEVGEANKAALESHFKENYPLANWGAYETELIQVAAVAISAIESMRRNGKPVLKNISEKL